MDSTRSKSCFPTPFQKRYLFVLGHIARFQRLVTAALRLAKAGDEDALALINRGLCEHLWIIAWVWDRDDRFQWLMVGNEVGKLLRWRFDRVAMEKYRILHNLPSGDASIPKIKDPRLRAFSAAIARRLRLTKLPPGIYSNPRRTPRNPYPYREIPKIADIAREAGYAWMYHQYYGLASQETHAARESLDMYVSVVPGAWAVIRHPTPNELQDRVRDLRMISYLLLVFLKERGCSVSLEKVERLARMP